MNNKFFQALGTTLLMVLTSAISLTGAQAQTLGAAFLVRDINPTSGSLTGSDPKEFVAIGRTLYFTANDGVRGVELWKSDGTTSGTVLVKDIYPGTTGSAPNGLMNMDGTLYFAASDGITNNALWRSDGSAAGTYKVKATIVVKNTYTKRSEFVAVGHTLFFCGSQGAYSTALMKSDGTAGGTVMVCTSDPTKVWSFMNPAVMGGVVYFSGSGPALTTGLWRSDGTEAGTSMVYDVRDAGGMQSPPTFPDHMLAVGGTLYFVARSPGYQLWKTDGTRAGTVQLTVYDIQNSERFSPYIDPCLTNLKGKVFLGMYDWATRFSLWRSDGTPPGTKAVTTTLYDSWPANLRLAGSLIFFEANGKADGSEELWRSDGTTSGTMRVKTLTGPTSDSLRICRLVGGNGWVCFRANEGANGGELWQSDGTPEGTRMVADIAPDAASSDPDSLTLCGDLLFFSAAAGPEQGRELWAIHAGNWNGVNAWRAYGP